MTKRKDDTPYMFYMTEGLKSEVVKYARKNDLSVAQAIRKAIKLLLKRK